VAKEGLYVADAALVTKDAEGNAKTLERESHHGWGRVQSLEPSSASCSRRRSSVGAIVGGLAGGGVAGSPGPSGEGRVKTRCEPLDKGEIALVAMVDTASLDAFKTSLTRAVEMHSEETGLTDDDLRGLAPA
jgi:hypothetical protein